MYLSALILFLHSLHPKLYKSFSYIFTSACKPFIILIKFLWDLVIFLNMCCTIKRWPKLQLKPDWSWEVSVIVSCDIHTPLMPQTTYFLFFILLLFPEHLSPMVVSPLLLFPRFAFPSCLFTLTSPSATFAPGQCPPPDFIHCPKHTKIILNSSLVLPITLTPSSSSASHKLQKSILYSITGVIMGILNSTRLRTDSQTPP